MDFFQLAKQRCTTRGFTDKHIPEKDLEYILHVGRIAPTACNQQPQRIIAVQKPKNIMKVQKAYRTFGSTCVLIVCRDRRNELIRPCDHMMLAAREKGIGSVMVGLFDPAIIRAEFEIPEYIVPTALLIMGYPEEFLSPERHSKDRKPLDETVMFECYSEKYSNPS